MGDNPGEFDKNLSLFEIIITVDLYFPQYFHCKT